MSGNQGTQEERPERPSEVDGTAHLVWIEKLLGEL